MRFIQSNRQKILQFFLAILISPIFCETTIYYKKVDQKIETDKCTRLSYNDCFCKNKIIIPVGFIFTENNDTYHYNNIERPVGPPFVPGTVKLEIKMPNVTDDATYKKNIYEVIDADNVTSTPVCSYDIYLCADQKDFKESLRVKIGTNDIINNNSNITIDDPYNYTIEYYYEIKALPLIESSIEFVDLNITHPIDQECTSPDDKLRCFTNHKTQISITSSSCPVKTLTIKPNYMYNETIKDKFGTLCDFAEYKPSTFVVNLQYLDVELNITIAEIVRTETTPLKINKTLRFDVSVKCTNPDSYLYTLNCTICNGNECELGYFLNESINSTFSIEVDNVTQSFDRLYCYHCIDNGALKKCEYKDFEKEPDTTTTTTRSTTSTTISSTTPVTNTKTAPDTNTSSSTAPPSTTTPPYDKDSTRSQIWVSKGDVIGIAIGCFFAGVTLSSIIFLIIYRYLNKHNFKNKNLYENPNLQVAEYEM